MPDILTRNHRIQITEHNRDNKSYYHEGKYAHQFIKRIVLPDHDISLWL